MCCGNIQQYLMKSPICKLYYKWKPYKKECSIFYGQNFTGTCDEGEMSPEGEIGNIPVKMMQVNFLHEVNCETKYTIPQTSCMWKSLKF